MHIKILNADEKHRVFQYVEGWNTCQDYEPTAACGNGLHYTDDTHWPTWIDYGDHFREVLDAVGTVEIDETKSKAEKLCLGPHRPFSDLLVTEVQRLAAVTQNGYVIKWVRNPSEQVQLAAVTENCGYAIRHITDPSEEIQLAAVTNWGHAIRHITDPSEEVQLTAVTQHGGAIKWVNDPSEAVQLAAVTDWQSAIQYIKGPSEAVKLAALKK